ncbi:MAG: hypothetical protein MR992_14650 [Lachnospiraceae bacterium]|nr:hypothetical protein [Lachnospiraceae bacterium]
MDYQKAINNCNTMISDLRANMGNGIKIRQIRMAEIRTLETAISAMQELKEYKEYGTPNGYKSALEAYDKCYSEKEIIDTELYKYQQIGSLEEVREAVEKHENDCSRCREKIYKHAIKKFSCLQEIDIKAYEELMSYRRIGTIKEVREAVEKHKAKKPLLGGNTDKLTGDIRICPCCCGIVGIDDMRADYCADCGQHIDWSEVEE